MEVPVELTAPRKALIQRAKDARDLLVSHKYNLGLQAVILFGSLARGVADYRSDVDILAVVRGNHKESSQAKDFILGNLYNDFEGEWPRVDVHTCSDSVIYGDITQYIGTPFGDFLECVRRDGVVIWER